MSKYYLFYIAIFLVFCASGIAQDEKSGQVVIKTENTDSPEPIENNASAEITSEQEPAERTTKRALAPPVNVEFLGKPYDEKFDALGSTLFPDAKVHKISMDEMSSEAFVVEDSLTLAINAKAWGIGAASISGDMKTRYGCYRAYQISEVIELDDSVPITAEIPENAVYYLWRIYLGHLYEMVAWGDSSVFNAQVKADWLVASCKAKGFFESHNLKSKAFGRGLKPIGGEAIFCPPHKTDECYTTTDAAAAPIFVQYRLISGREPQKAEEFKFSKPFEKPGLYTVEVVSAIIRKTDHDGDDWDFLGNKPDPYVLVFLDECKNDKFIFGTSPEMNNLLPEWKYTKKQELSPKNKLCLIVADKDAGKKLSNHDFIGKCETEPLEEQLGNTIKIKDCGQAQELILKVYK